MGLAAGQARLLSITSRKSDCEFQSMRLSHEKISISRALSYLSNEYENSLNQSKLYYDYYGNGDTSTPLSYNILMIPSALNDYLPTTITDSSGRVILDSKYASVAKAAGIPQEGLGTLPSESTRNKFVQYLYNNGLITETLSDKIQGLPYNQGAGFGNNVTVVNNLETTTYEEVLKMFDDISVGEYLNSIDDFLDNDCANISDSSGIYTQDEYQGRHEVDENDFSKLTLGDILRGTDSDGNSINSYIIWIDSADGQHSTNDFVDPLKSDTIWNSFIDAIYSVLYNGTEDSEEAFNYAVSSFKDKIIRTNCTSTENSANQTFAEFADKHRHTGDRKGGSSHEEGDCRNSIFNYNGICYAQNGGDDYNSYAGIDLTTALKQFITYYADIYNGSAKTDVYGFQLLEVKEGGEPKSGNRLIDDNTEFVINNGTEVSSDDLAHATFYDCLFNQICANGWCENNDIQDNDYLQQMLKNGMLYISRAEDDGYYYQKNYATDTYIKEISDESAIAQAEAKYSIEKARLNSKEEELDLKMKNLDTEISSLTTEYDTVKNTISKNIEKSFKRYNA